MDDSKVLGQDMISVKVLDPMVAYIHFLHTVQIRTLHLDQVDYKDDLVNGI